MLDLNRFEAFCNRLTIQPRDETTGKLSSVIPFRFNPSQQKIMAQVHRRVESRKPLWLIFLKARRLGISTWSSALLDAHCLQKSAARAMIVAQLTMTSKAMFAQCREFAKCLPMRLPKPTQRELYFPHHGDTSVLSHVTAKTVIGGRGLTLSAIHMTEAAFYPGEDSFVALLNTVSSTSRDNVVVIETTANGIEGPGQAFYDYWNDAVAGVNDFLAIFLPWYEDPGTFLPDELAPDAPQGEYERWLMKEFHVTRGQIAWHRKTLATKCKGSIYKWRQEYPALAEEAFVSSGDPVFDYDEMGMMRRTVREPIFRGRYDANSLVEMPDGPLHIWEHPIPSHSYYFGVDAAKGQEEGDFAAIVGFDGDTGHQVLRYTARIPPESLATVVNFLGRLYNEAMLNIEVTGGWGYVCLKKLRDRFNYSNLYYWRGRDDRPDTRPRQALGWETTDRTRMMVLDLFRQSLRTALPGDSRCPACDDVHTEVCIRDADFVQQASKAQAQLGWRWRVIRGHDDNFMAGLLGWVCVCHYHIPNLSPVRKSSILAESKQECAEGLNFLDSPEMSSMGVIGMTGEQHLAKINRWQSKGSTRLLGI